MTVRNLSSLLAPRSVAFVGASPEPGSVGLIVARNLLSGGFDGPIWFVNPRHEAVLDVRCFQSLAALPDVPELVVIATPPETVPDIIAEAGAKGARAAVVITAGVTGELRQRMLNAARTYCLRIEGPNCIGLLLPHIGLNASFSRRMPIKGDLAVISQSGALVTTIVDWTASRGIGLSQVISLGDMADADFGDFLDYLAGDITSRAILIYMEAMTDAAKFISAARRASRVKPVIILKSGRNAAAAKAAMSHTGALAGADAAYNAAFRRAGVLRVNELRQLFDAAEILSAVPHLHGERLTILTNGGGVGVLATDELADLGGKLTELPAMTLQQLDECLPPTWSRANPVDIIGDAGPERYQKAAEILLADPATHALLVMNCPTAMASSEEAAQVVVDLASAHRRQRPRKVILTSWLGEDAAEPSRQLFAKADIPTFATPEAAVEGFWQLVRYRRAQEELMQVPPSAPEALQFDRAKADHILAEARRKGRTMLLEAKAKELLASYGIPVVRTLRAATPEQVELHAAELLRDHRACVVKIVSDDLPHKSDFGGVRLAIASAREARTAAEEMLLNVHRLRPDAVLRGFTVQAMIERANSHELIVGASEDATVGPLMMFGAGGTAVEVTADTAHALPPLDLKLAYQMMRETRIYGLLKGYRDRPAANLDAIAMALVRLSYLVARHREIREVDINPLLADEHGVVALDARIRIADEAEEPRRPLAVRPFPVEWERTIAVEGMGEVTLRPIRPDDEPHYVRLFDRISADDLRMRFFTAAPERTFRFFARMTQIDYAREMAFIAVYGDEVLGVARLIADPDGRRAEFAVIVRSDLKGRGLGSALMQHLIAYAKSEGLGELIGDVLAENTGMLAMCRSLGFTSVYEPQSNVFRLSLDLGRGALGSK
ncbi:GNAT family N-acetyltransferase [Hyphomicrobium sulfonivorans]|uniref:GNAT family N-acetyltransferase n=1 Tax=Hyphomicrobium sulfonivorans TaxID=121290 RepID=UPI0015706968|nr:bifunctional acetate--CoA ligase family protein/GNAT family N-acetyltransferase [Hyphomicrobium sulfonivorans]NSL72408.1 GNAT family N-acetyltransferase [Hyphomicrobium sulfonivorans]